MIEAILNGLLPVAFIIFLGWYSARRGILKHDDAGVLASLVLRFALPFALFEGAIKTSPDKLENVGLVLGLTFGLMGGYLIALGVGRFVFKHDLRTSTMQALVCSFPDMAYFGAPILASMFGPEGFLAVLIGNLITSLVMIPLTIVLTSASDKQEAGHGWQDVWLIVSHSVVKAITNPIVWLPMLGVALSFGHVMLPGPVMASAELIARSAGGVSLFALGLMLYGERLRLNADVLANIGIKNFLQPALMVLGVVLFGLTGTSAQQVVITGATPTATAAAMFALKNKTYTADATSTIFLSTILGILTEAVLIGYFSR